MKIFHHIGFNVQRDRRLARVLRKLDLEATGVEVKRFSSGLVVFDISEEHPCWKEISKATGDALDMQYTVFSKAELLASEWLRLTPTYETHYPQPERNWVTQPNNFSNNCEECGIYEQTSSFQIKSEPGLKRFDFFSLFWTYTLFTRKDVIQVLRKNKTTGFEVREVLLGKRIPSQNIKQIFVPGIANPGFLPSKGYESFMCATCGMVKYHPHRRGMMKLRKATFDGVDADIVRGHEWFGSGHMAFREFLVSNKFAKLIIERGWRGILLQAVEIVE